MYRFPTRLICLTLIIVTTAAILPTAALADSPDERIQEAIKVLAEMAEQSDVQSMAKMLRSAKGVAIFPKVIKAGLMFGGRYGRGLVLRFDPETNSWYGPSFITLKGISYGFQFGIQKTGLVLVITNERGLEGFTSDEITLGGDISVAAGPLGRHAEASTDVELEASIYSYSISKGIFAGLSLEGAVIETDHDVNAAFWGNEAAAEDLLRRPAADAEVKQLISELEQLL